MIWHALIPDLVHEVLVFEHVKKLLLGSCVSEVETCLKCIMEVVVGREFFLLTILGCLLKPLQECSVCSRKAILLLLESRIAEVILPILSIN